MVTDKTYSITREDNKSVFQLTQEYHSVYVETDLCHLYYGFILQYFILFRSTLFSLTERNCCYPYMNELRVSINPLHVIC